MVRVQRSPKRCSGPPKRTRTIDRVRLTRDSGEARSHIFSSDFGICVGLRILESNLRSPHQSCTDLTMFLERRLSANPHGCSLRAQACHAGGRVSNLPTQPRIALHQFAAPESTTLVFERQLRAFEFGIGYLRFGSVSTSRVAQPVRPNLTVKLSGMEPVVAGSQQSAIKSHS